VKDDRSSQGPRVTPREPRLSASELCFVLHMSFWSSSWNDLTCEITTTTIDSNFFVPRSATMLDSAGSVPRKFDHMLAVSRETVFAVAGLARKVPRYSSFRP
jgi:hypothetical protein